MKYYCAPLDGLTDRCYRRVHSKYFNGIDCYYMPFLSPTQTHRLSQKEQRELPPADQEPYQAVPQLLTKSVDDFLWAAQCCAERGYQEINLNLGCPSGTVVTKGKGAGMLKNLEELYRFMEGVFTGTQLSISVKTRIGMESPDEFPSILKILNQFPIKELTVHPRVRKAFYKGSVELQAFEYALQNSRAPLCYNGDLCTSSDIAACKERYSPLSAIMFGRGLIANPALAQGELCRARLISFHEELFDEYCRAFENKRNAMCRMKEHWHCLIGMFKNGEKQMKQLNKANDYDIFRSISKEILHNLPLRTECEPSWREKSPF